MLRWIKLGLVTALMLSLVALCIYGCAPKPQEQPPAPPPAVEQPAPVAPDTTAAPAAPAAPAPAPAAPEKK
ncbi:MAG: hypothetical protein N3A72_01200 [bacterium]|nr:hypothetical protein [bacterium]